MIMTNLILESIDVQINKSTVTFGMWNQHPALWITGLVLLFLFYGAILFGFIKICKRKACFFILGISFAFTLTGYIFWNIPLLIITCTLSSAGFAVCMFANLGDLRSFLASPFKKTTAKSAHFGVEKIFDTKTLYKNIETAVLNLSKTKTGALITLERNTSLNEIMKNGVPVNAPVSPELLATIFYEGTRLHDGAVVIHGNNIVAASVFFTPTTKPFAGKYGSRHRAAIGVSEVSDAITIVVSEETGRISFAVNGELESVDPTNFLRVLENYMADNSEAN